ncbi:MAG TPA: spondin domain-containing protein [Dehalococcoidia bacterium]
MQASSLRRWALAPALVIATAAALAFALVASPAAGQSDVTYTVKVENLTSGQPLTPPVVVTHSSAIDIFESGQAASAEIQALAENGNNDPLLTLVGGSSAVYGSTSGTAPILPGETATLSVTAPAGSLISSAMMLICTNDGFSGLDSVALPASGSTTVDVNSYDAGTETNTEDFADIVPPCQAVLGVTSDDDGTGESNPALAEGGVVSAHAGIQGGTDLTTADHGWTDPVARITVTAEASGLPTTGGTPLESSSGIAWALYLAIGGVLLLAAGSATLVVSRRTLR